MRTLSLILILSIAGCSSENQADKAPTTDELGTATTTITQDRAIHVETAYVLPQSFDDVIQLTGSIEANHDIMVSAEAGGRIEYVVPLGTFVSAGQTVAKFDNRLAELAKRAAEATYLLAEDTFSRKKALARDSVISQLEFESAKATRDQAKAMFDQADRQLSNSQLISPLSGRIEEKLADAGELATPGTPMVRIVNTQTVKVVAGVPERHAASIKKGAAVVLRLNAYPNRTWEGNISFVGGVIEPKSRTFKIEVILDNADAALKPAMISDLFITRQHFDDVLLAPQTAILRDERGPSLFIAVKEDDQFIARRRAVELGPSSNGYTVIATALSEGEQLIIVGQGELTDGDLLAIDNAQDVGLQSHSAEGTN